MSKKPILALSAALILCIAATWALLFVGRDIPQDTEESIYYFTNYTSSQYLTAASIENQTGSIVLAQTNGKYYAMTDTISGSDEEEVAGFFQAASHISLSQMVEDAVSADEQYGLAVPQAEITLQNVDGGGLVFYLGNAAPNQSGFYTCLAGDERVFIMENEQATRYLSDISRFLDLTLYPSLAKEGIKTLAAIAVSSGEEIRYSLRQVYASDDGSTVYYAMEQPWELLLSANQSKTAIITPLRQLEGIAVSALTPEQSGLLENADTLCLSYKDGSKITVLVGSRTQETTLVMTQGDDKVLCVPTASLSFMDAQAYEIIGKNLLDLNINDIRTLTVNQHQFVVTSENGKLAVTRDGMPFDQTIFLNTIVTALKHISIQGDYVEDEASKAAFLQIKLETNIAEETIDLSFYPLDGRKCAVQINGQPAVWCDLVAVEQLLKVAA